MIEPIGLFHCEKKYKNEARRQGLLQAGPGRIDLLAGKNFEQALTGLEAFSHIWLTYLFHHNSHWKPMVNPPRLPGEKKGVFATRSPYRPNPIGLSAVRLLKVSGLTVWVEQADLLDQTPILDIKPYLTYSDSIPDASAGWIGSVPEKLSIEITECAEHQLSWLKERGVHSIHDFISEQLEYDPLNSKKKRVRTESPDLHVLSYRTWRVEFSLADSKIKVLQIRSGYTSKELDEPSDIYEDKKTHREFLLRDFTL